MSVHKARGTDGYSRARRDLARLVEKAKAGEWDDVEAFHSEIDEWILSQSEESARAFEFGKKGGRPPKTPPLTGGLTLPKTPPLTGGETPSLTKEGKKEGINQGIKEEKKEPPIAPHVGFNDPDPCNAWEKSMDGEAVELAKHFHKKRPSTPISVIMIRSAQDAFKMGHTLKQLKEAVDYYLSERIQYPKEKSIHSFARDPAKWVDAVAVWERENP